MMYYCYWCYTVEIEFLFYAILCYIFCIYNLSPLLPFPLLTLFYYLPLQPCRWRTAMYTYMSAAAWDSRESPPSTTQSVQKPSPSSGFYTAGVYIMVGFIVFYSDLWWVYVICANNIMSFIVFRCHCFFIAAVIVL